MYTLNNHPSFQGSWALIFDETQCEEQGSPLSSLLTANSLRCTSCPLDLQKNGESNTFSVFISNNKPFCLELEIFARYSSGIWWNICASCNKNAWLKARCSVRFKRDPRCQPPDKTTHKINFRIWKIWDRSMDSFFFPQRLCSFVRSYGATSECCIMFNLSNLLNIT